MPYLTDRQLHCLQYIADFYVAKGYYPSHREIVGEMGLRTATAATYLEPLLRKGFIRRVERARSRNIRLTKLALERLAVEAHGVREEAVRTN